MTKKCVIFGAAEFDAPACPLERGDLIIAADGGLIHLEKLGRKPDVILGDFDSLGYIPTGAAVFPVEKDDTDTMLALRYALDRGYREFHIYGGMDGKRLDHTVANFQALAFLRRHDAHGYLIGKDHIATVIRNETVRFPRTPAGLLSVFCMGADATGICLRGLQYPLENGTLTADFPLGVSNHFVGESGEVSVENGSLLLIWDRNIGFPAVLE